MGAASQDKRLGVQDGMSFAEYHDVDAVSSSRLRAMARSPAYCKLVMDAPPAPAAAMRLGAAVHSLILEPQIFERLYRQSEHDGRTNAGKAEREAATKEAIELLSVEEWDAAHCMAKSLATHPRFAALMSKARGVEEAVFWEMDERTCKARRDAVGDGWILDIKTTSSLNKFPWQAGSLGYPIQAAWYRIANEELDLKPASSFFFAVVCSGAPYESAIFLLEDAWGEGRRKAISLFEMYRRCEKSGIWPAHVDNLLTLSVRSEEERGEEWR